MKSNNYFFLTLCIGLVFGASNAQEAFVTGAAKVKVQPNTLFYFGDNLNVTSSTVGVFENAGNVKVDGNYVNSMPSTKGENFVSTWADNQNYGQVIIKNQAAANAGFLSMEKGKISPVTYSWGQFAMPFVYNNGDDAMQNLFNRTYVNGANRYYASMMVWDNTSKAEFDHLRNNTAVSPIGYYILNLTYNSAGIKPLMTGAGKLQYYGKAANMEYSGAMNTSIYFPTTPWSGWRNMKNSHNEKYSTYIAEYVRSASDPDYNFLFGKYYFQFGNPYTSNIDLAYIGLPNDGVTNYDDGVYIPNLLAVVKSSSATWNEQNGLSTSAFVMAKFDAVNGEWTGAAEALIAKPFEPFVIVLKDDTAPGDFTFTDKLKTFNMTPGQMGTNVTITPKNDSKANISSLTDISSSNSDFYQVGLKLYNNGLPTENSIFVAVTNSVSNGVPNDLEADYSDFGTQSGFYLDQEKADGTAIKTAARKMHINTINSNYVNKPIPLFFNRKSGDNTTYELKADLFYQNIFNKLDHSDMNFADGNSFFFYDGVKNILLPITADFSYMVLPQGTNSNREYYQLYWNGGPVYNKEDLSSDELALGSTIIYRDNDLHKVRFNDQWSSAEIMVYDMTGRNIMAYDNVDANVDFSINVPKAGAYIVRIEANTGEVYTQKILK